jgi:hypothetical protein
VADDRLPGFDDIGHLLGAEVVTDPGVIEELVDALALASERALSPPQRYAHLEPRAQSPEPGARARSP